jgi:hypothetical protein
MVPVILNGIFSGSDPTRNGARPASGRRLARSGRSGMQWHGTMHGHSHLTAATSCSPARLEALLLLSAAEALRESEGAAASS